MSVGPNGHGPPESVETRLFRVEAVITVTIDRDGTVAPVVAVVFGGRLSDFEVMQQGDHAFAVATDMDPLVQLVTAIPNQILHKLVNQLTDYMKEQT